MDSKGNFRFLPMLYIVHNIPKAPVLCRNKTSAHGHHREQSDLTQIGALA